MLFYLQINSNFKYNSTYSQGNSCSPNKLYQFMSIGVMNMELAKNVIGSFIPHLYVQSQNNIFKSDALSETFSQKNMADNANWALNCQNGSKWHENHKLFESRY